MKKLPKIVAIILMVAGVVMMVVGVWTYVLIHRELADEHITVSEDAENFAGDQVEGPFTAYSQATVIKKHALEAGGGLTYAQLGRDDPVRTMVMQASFLRASLFTSLPCAGDRGAGSSADRGTWRSARLTGSVVSPRRPSLSTSLALHVPRSQRP